MQCQCRRQEEPKRRSEINFKLDVILAGRLVTVLGMDARQPEEGASGEVAATGTARLILLSTDTSYMRECLER